MLKTMPTEGDTSWFTRDRLGLFIHWGLYSQGARHEWLMNREEIPPDVYEERYFKRFDPDLYDPNAWAKAAAGAGMKYFVITTKHHEGFCLWDSKHTDYKATNTAAKRDLLKPMIKAFRDQNMRVGLYYSLLDWHHPDFTIDDMHPLRNHPDRQKLNEGRTNRKYTKYLHDQTRELLTKFGQIDVMWYDFSYPRRTNNPKWDGKGREVWDSEKLIKLIRKLQPGIILDDRLDLPDPSQGWDVKTPEQFQPREWVKFNGQPVVWEACQTMSGSWGYHRDEATWRTPDQIVRTLIDCVSKGGNLLLNVGPTGRGEIDSRAMNVLSNLGAWMKRHDRSIYGCTQAPDEFKAPTDCRFTYNPDTHRLYLHLFAWPYKHVALDGLAGRVEYAQLLHDASEVKMKGLEAWQAAQVGADNPRTLTIDLPQVKPDVAVPVVELFLKK